LAPNGVLDYHPLGYDYVFEKETPADCQRAIALGPIHRLKNGGQKDMPKVTESALVAAPTEKVFQMFIEPQRAVMFVPGLSRINNISPDKRSWDYEFNWLGLVISGHSECTAFEPPKRYQFKTLSGNKSTWTYRCEPDGANTKLSLEVEYEVPQQQLARFASETVLQKMNQNTAREIVSHIKTLLES
jgi:carbon monoxide dehydrogenase subunit G